MTSQTQNLSQLTGEDAEYLLCEKVPIPQYFRLLKSLWIKIPTIVNDSGKLKQFERNYGVEKVSNGLTFKNCNIAIKGTLSILLYLSTTDSYITFFNEEFFENVIGVLLNDELKSLHFMIARLIRLLETHKGFGDWLKTKGDSVQENRLWKRLYDLSHQGEEEEIRKECSRAVKEGLRINAISVKKWCIVPPEELSKLLSEVFWKITDDDIILLDKLIESDSDGAEDDRDRLKLLQAANLKIRNENDTNVAVVEKELADEKASTNKIRDQLLKVYGEINEVNERMMIQNKGRPVEQPSAETLELIEELKSSVAQVSKDVNLLWQGSTNLPSTMFEVTENLRILGEEDKVLGKEVSVLQSQFSVTLKDHLIFHRTLLKNALLNARMPGPGVGANLSSRALSPNRAALSQGGVGVGVGVGRAQSPSRGAINQSLLSSSPHFSPGFPPHPPGSPNSTPYSREENLPPEWSKKLDPKTGRYYFINRITGQTQWSAPRN